jgi:hypothetical protein
VFCYIARELSNLNLLLDILLKARVHNFSLPRFKPITNAGDGPSTVSNGKQDKLFVDEI